MNGYPQVEVNLAKIAQNIKETKKRTDACGIAIAGVVKGVWADPNIAKVYDAAGLAHIASSRTDHLRKLKQAGIKTPLMLIRTPMPDEVEAVVRYADISLQSEPQIIAAMNAAALAQHKVHDIILMQDIGDLREGFFQLDELTQTAREVETAMPSLRLVGVGTNLGCYGALEPTPAKLSELVAAAEAVEAVIGRKLTYISGGATSSIPRVLDGTMPKRINHLRIGELMLIGRDQQVLRGYDMPFLRTDALTLKAQIIEVKEKPSQPQGESVLDSFGNRPVFEDKGMMKRALLAVGQADYGALLYGDTLAIIPRDTDVEIIAASSDHTILDVTKAKRDYKVGDVMEFDLWYTAMLHLFAKDAIAEIYVNRL